MDPVKPAQDPAMSPRADSGAKPKKKEYSDEWFADTRKKLADAVGSQAASKNRENYINDVKFSCSDDQWPAEMKRMRGNRPALTFNRLNGVVKQIIGDYRQNKIAIKVLPASGEASEEKAELISGLIRNIEQQSNAPHAYTNALECSARGGFGYFRILTRYTGDDSFDQDIVIQPVHNPLNVHFDPAARLLNREDANYCFITESMTHDDFKRMYPGAEPVSFQAAGSDAVINWCTESEVTVAEYYSKETYTARLVAFSNGIVMEVKDESEVEAMAAIGVTVVDEREAERTRIVWRKMTGKEVLDEKTYEMKYIPVVPVIGEEINVEGEVLTRSAIFYAKHAQQIYNYAKTTATEMVALAPKAPWLVTAKHIQGFQDQWDNLNASPAPYVVFNPDTQVPGLMPTRNQPTPQPIGEISMALGAADDIKATTGIYDASLGAQGNEISGVAIRARQNEGDNSTYIFIDNLKAAIEHGGRIVLEMIRLVYDAERVVRILDLEGNTSMEKINERKYDPMTGVTEILNSITVGKYDVVVTTGPSLASQKMEMLNSLPQLLPSLPIVGQAAPDLIIRAMPFHGAEQIAERVKRMLPPQITVDPDSEEGKAMANKPAPPDPELMRQKAELERHAQELEMKHQAKLEEIRMQHDAKIKQIKADAELKAYEHEMRMKADRQDFAQDLLFRREAKASELRDTMAAKEAEHAERVRDTNHRHAVEYAQLASGSHEKREEGQENKAMQMMAQAIQAIAATLDKLAAAEVAKE